MTNDQSENIGHPGGGVAGPVITPQWTDARPASSSPAIAQVAAVTATLGLAAVAWVVAVRQMNEMNMGVATPRGSFASFVGLWVSMMAAMMFPGAVGAVSRRVRADGSPRTVPRFLGSYLAGWTVMGLAAFVVYRPHGTFAAGIVVIAAGVYEMTPIKRRLRERCRDSVRPLEFSVCCVGSSVALMAVLPALGIMSITWMIVIAGLVLVQKLVPARTAVDVPLAVVIVGLGILIVVAPSSIPALTPAM